MICKFYRWVEFQYLRVYPVWIYVLVMFESRMNMLFIWSNQNRMQTVLKLDPINAQHLFIKMKTILQSLSLIPSAFEVTTFKFNSSLRLRRSDLSLLQTKALYISNDLINHEQIGGLIRWSSEASMTNAIKCISFAKRAAKLARWRTY